MLEKETANSRQKVMLRPRAVQEKEDLLDRLAQEMAVVPAAPVEAAATHLAAVETVILPRTPRIEKPTRIPTKKKMMRRTRTTQMLSGSSAVAVLESRLRRRRTPVRPRVPWS